MMKLKYIVGLTGLVIILAITIIVITNYNFIYKVNSNNTSVNVSTTINPTIFTSIDPNSSLNFPPNDYAINHINWSQYPNLSSGYVYTVYVAGPNDVISHKFIEVQICTEIKGTEDETIIYNQLNEAAKEARKLYGSNSDINIIGTKGGVARWFAEILPYEDKIYN